VNRFGISPQQASADIAAYLALAPENARIDHSNKVYRRGSGFAPLFPKDAARWAADAREAGDRSVLPRERLPMPTRREPAAVLETLFACYETRRPAAIRYQSLTSPDPSLRVICPHAVADTGDRLHVRAWDSNRRIFADFVLGRILRAEPSYEYIDWVDDAGDTEWHGWTDVLIAPHDALTTSQRAIIELDYGMTDGQATVRVRRALVLYVLDRLGLLEAVRTGDGRPDAARGIRCLNSDALRPLLP
jgi:hypothetical protein